MRKRSLATNAISLSLCGTINDPIEAAGKYLADHRSLMFPNPVRVELLAQLIDEFFVHRVVNPTWQVCHTYDIESCHIENFVLGNGVYPFCILKLITPNLPRNNLGHAFKRFWKW